jgi:hypothetical protein
MGEFKIDKEYVRMITEYYERKCPCWGGKHTCPCPHFAQTQECKCGAILRATDRRAQNPKYKPYTIDFSKLNNLLKDYKCPEDQQTCFCKEFLETGNCKARIFQKQG